LSAALDDRLGEAIAIAEVLVSVIEGWDCFQVQSGEQFQTITFFHMTFVFILATLAFSDITCEQYNDGMKVGACQSTNPEFWMVRASSSENFRSGRHPLTKFLGKVANEASATPRARRPLQVNPMVTHRESSTLEPTALAVPTLSIKPSNQRRPPVALRKVKNS
jgi:hypothetical protein